MHQYNNYVHHVLIGIGGTCYTLHCNCDWIGHIDIFEHLCDFQGSCRVVKRFVDNSDQERGGRKHRSFPGGT